MRRNFTADSFVFGRKDQENAHITFSVTLQGENFQDASELHSKPLRFWTINPDVPPGTFFCKPCRWRTSKMRLIFTANSFVFGRTNRENAPRTFYQSGKAKTSKM